MHYKDQKTRLLSFAEFLTLVGGGVPLLVEVKSAGGVPPKGATRQDCRAGQRLAGPDRADVVQCRAWPALAKLAPKIACGLIAGVEQLPSNWRVAAGGPGEGAAFDALLGHGAGRRRAFTRSTGKMLPEAAAWMARRPARLPLFSWTIRTPEQREIAARWADAPIFETYEP